MKHQEKVQIEAYIDAHIDVLLESLVKVAESHTSRLADLERNQMAILERTILKEKPKSHVKPLPQK